jgi:hypothetical protein
MKKIIFFNIQIVEDELKLILKEQNKLFRMKKKKMELLKKKLFYHNLTQEH